MLQYLIQLTHTPYMEGKISFVCEALPQKKFYHVTTVAFQLEAADHNKSFIGCLSLSQCLGSPFPYFKLTLSITSEK